MKPKNNQRDVATALPKKLLDPPTSDKARAYVQEEIFRRGGWREAAAGLRHKSIPYVVGIEKALTITRIFALLFRLGIASITAIFPVIIRKIITPGNFKPTQTQDLDFLDSLIFLFESLLPFSHIDYILFISALSIYFTPKILDVLDNRKPVYPHTPYNDLTAAINEMPAISNSINNSRAIEKSINLALCAARDEMSHLIGEDGKNRSTEAALLVFTDATGESMTVKSRTANHESKRSQNRTIASTKLMAYYVARIGRNYAEHDFKNKRNPFPQFRNSVSGNVPVNYRSVLFLPIITSIKINGPSISNQAPASDSCIGVLCIHSKRAYRFWRWGDHKKGVGGFSDVAFHRAMPYIALIERLLEGKAPKVPLEVS